MKPDDDHSAQQELLTVQRDLARKQDELARLCRAGILISSRMSLDETLETILRMALEVTGARYGILRLVDKTGTSLVTRAIAGDHLNRPAVEALPLNTTSVTGYVAKIRKPVCIRDVREPPWNNIYYPLDHALDMRAELAVPLIGASGRLEGVLNLESPVVGAFSEDDSLLLQALATQAVIAIQEARLLDALQTTAARLLTRSLAEVLAHLVELACDLINVGGSAIWTVRDGEPYMAAAYGNLPRRAQTLACHAIDQRQAMCGSDGSEVQGGAWALVVPILAQDGAVVGAFGVFDTRAHQDVAATADWSRKVVAIMAHYAALAIHHDAAQAALHAAQEQRMAAETFAAIGDVAANLLHQLNNKIGVIPVKIEGILDKGGEAVASDPYVARSLEEIGRSAREAMTAVRDTLSHLQAAPVGPVSVVAAVREALLRLPPTVKADVAGLEDLPPVLAGQAGLTFVFVNLLENAVDAMGGRGSITIRGHALPEAVEVYVRDSGPGIAPGMQERIFELNVSARKPGRSPRLGFGLWWVKSWMARLGGSIAVSNNKDGGACFTLRLPRAGRSS